MNAIMEHSDSLGALVYKLKRLMHAWVRGHILPEDSSLLKSQIRSIQP